MDEQKSVLKQYHEDVKKYGGRASKPNSPIENIEVDGELYFVLTNANGILAVYRDIRNEPSMFQDFEWVAEEDWPEEIIETFD